MVTVLTPKNNRYFFKIGNIWRQKWNRMLRRLFFVRGQRMTNRIHQFCLKFSVRTWEYCCFVYFLYFGRGGLPLGIDISKGMEIWTSEICILMRYILWQFWDYVIECCFSIPLAGTIDQRNNLYSKFLVNFISSSEILQHSSEPLTLHTIPHVSPSHCRGIC